MNLLKLTAVLALLGHALTAPAADGLMAVESPHGAQDTMNRLEAGVKQRGLNVFARIDPAFLAQRHGLPTCPMVENLRKALAALASAAVAR